MLRADECYQRNVSRITERLMSRLTMVAFGGRSCETVIASAWNAFQAF